MKPSLKITFIVTALLLTTSLTYASPSQLGYSGVITTPNGDVLKNGGFAISHTSLKDDGNVTGIDFGLSGKLELGAAIVNQNSTDKTYINAKYQLVPETIVTPSIALGMNDIFAKDGRSVYVAASKSLPLGFKLNAGVNNQSSDTRLFYGVEKTFNPLGFIAGNNMFPATTIKAEYDGHNYNYGVSLATLPGLKVDVGRRNHQSYFGANFTFN